MDLLVFWEIPSQHKSGHINVHGLMLGARHAGLDRIIEEVEGTKAKRSMYAETRKENMEVLDAIRTSEWNQEMRPLVLSYKGVTPKTHDFSTGYALVQDWKTVDLAESFLQALSSLFGIHHPQPLANVTRSIYPHIEATRVCRVCVYARLTMIDSRLINHAAHFCHLHTVADSLSAARLAPQS